MTLVPITASDLPEPLPTEKVLRHLIDHVHGFGARHWLQGDYIRTIDIRTIDIRTIDPKRPDFDDPREWERDDKAWSERAAANECNTACCIAGETAMMHGLTYEDIGALGYRWDEVCTMLGVPPEFQHPDLKAAATDDDDVWDLFNGGLTRDQVLKELEYRLAVLLEGEGR